MSQYDLVGKRNGFYHEPYPKYYPNKLQTDLWDLFFWVNEDECFIVKVKHKLLLYHLLRIYTIYYIEGNRREYEKLDHSPTYQDNS